MTTAADGWGRGAVRRKLLLSGASGLHRRPSGPRTSGGVSVFCGIKIAQTPFFFQLSGGLGGQHGQQYLSGVVQADYLDGGTTDVITTERQRINWEDPSAAPLLAWGQQRVKSLLSIWKLRRSEEKVRAIIDEKVADFSSRLERLRPSEAKTVRRALVKIAGVESIDQLQFTELGHAILTAWEAGRLREIIEDVSRMNEMDAAVLIGVLVEHQVLSALHAAEVIEAQG